MPFYLFLDFILLSLWHIVCWAIVVPCYTRNLPERMLLQFRFLFKSQLTALTMYWRFVFLVTRSLEARVRWIRMQSKRNLHYSRPVFEAQLQARPMLFMLDSYWARKSGLGFGASWTIFRKLCWAMILVVIIMVRVTGGSWSFLAGYLPRSFLLAGWDLGIPIMTCA
jgi:hypothetical protein